MTVIRGGTATSPNKDIIKTN